MKVPRIQIILLTLSISLLVLGFLEGECMLALVVGPNLTTAGSGLGENST